MVKVTLVNGKWVELEKGSPDGMYVNGLLKTNLDDIKKTIKDDWDYIYVCDGEAGSGKSTLVQQIAYYCSDGKLTLDQVCFTGQQFKDAVLKAKKYDAIIFDEAFRGLSARAAMTALNRSIVEMLNEIRQRNLFVFLLLPSIWDLDSYARLHRSKGCIHVYTYEGRKRGRFKFYKNTDYYKRFFSAATNRYLYPEYEDMSGDFPKFCPIDEEAYRKKKHAALNSTALENEAATEEAQREEKIQRLLAIDERICERFPKVTQVERGYVLGIAVATLKEYIMLHKNRQKRGVPPEIEGGCGLDVVTECSVNRDERINSTELPNTTVLGNAPSPEPPEADNRD